MSFCIKQHHLIESTNVIYMNIFYRTQRISEMLFLIRDDDDDLTFVRKLFSHVKLHKSFHSANTKNNLDWIFMKFYFLPFLPNVLFTKAIQ